MLGVVGRSAGLSDCSVFVNLCCLWVCHHAGVIAFLMSEVDSAEEAVIPAIYVGAVLAETVMRSSLISSCSLFCSLMFSYWR